MARGEQTILFLNRRGASRMLQCVSCGQVPECPLVQRAPHLPQRQSPADVPLLRLFPSRFPNAAPSAAVL